MLYKVKWTDVFGTDCNVKSSSPAYPFLETLRGASMITTTLRCNTIVYKYFFL
jgi:hypothetical protein